VVLSFINFLLRPRRALDDRMKTKLHLALFSAGVLLGNTLFAQSLGQSQTESTGSIQRETVVNQNPGGRGNPSPIVRWTNVPPYTLSTDPSGTVMMLTNRPRPELAVARPKPCAEMVIDNEGGMATAKNGPHTAHFYGNLNTYGAVSIDLPGPRTIQTYRRPVFSGRVRKASVDRAG
jgi:hypothetical protein